MCIRDRHTSQALTELEQLTSRKNLQQSKWISYFEQKGAGSALARIRNAIINVNTGLAGVGAMFEIFNWVEANYKRRRVHKHGGFKQSGIYGGVADSCVHDFVCRHATDHSDVAEE